jgi:hypothetical protein
MPTHDSDLEICEIWLDCRRDFLPVFVTKVADRTVTAVIDAWPCFWSVDTELSQSGSSAVPVFL